MTRRERNENFEQDHLTPDLDIPDYAEYLYQWYFEISDRLRRVSDGVCSPIPPSEFLAWVTLTRNLVRDFEYGILSAMDLAFCDEMNSELKDFRERERERLRHNKT